MGYLKKLLKNIVNSKKISFNQIILDYQFHLKILQQKLNKFGCFFLL